MSEPLLRLAEELERRDERAAAELAELERLGRELEQLRAAAEAAASFLAGLPAALAAVDGEAAVAEAGRVAAAEAARLAEERLARAEERGKEDERLAAARAAQHARDDLREAELRVEHARAERARLEREGEERRREGAELERGAGALAERLAALPRVAHEAAAPPAAGLDGVLAWASRARGGLLVAGAGVASERDRVAREATELVAAVSGDPRTLSGAAGIRERIAREIAR